MRRLVVSPSAPDASVIRSAVDVLEAGDVVGFPTDTLYGLAADPFSARAVARVLDIKGRPGDRGLPLVAADLAQVEACLSPLSSMARRLAEHFWPGPLTLVIPAPPTLAAAVTAGTGTVAVRVPAHAVSRALCAAAHRPLVATSANLTGRPPSANADEVAQALEGRLSVILDAGSTAGGLPSTIVDVTQPAARLVRAGAIPWEKVTAWLDRG